MDRRQFIATGLAVVGTVLLDGCGGSSSSSDLVLVPNDWEFMSGGDYRLAILLASAKQNGAPLTLNSPVTIQVGAQNAPLGPPLPMVIHADGPEPTYALTTYRFDKPGVYTLRAKWQGKTASLPITVIEPSASATPVVGQKLPSVVTPTPADAQGVNPVCTATPQCPFHAISLDAALARGDRIALLFATPALCQSKFCGPVLNNLQSVSAPWLQTVTFIHNEIYTDLSGTITTKAVNTYKLEHEPMLYLAGADGVIKTRIDNLFDQTEAKDALTKAFGPAA